VNTARAAIVFPGQGTQSPGMGAPWRDHPAWKIVDQAEGAMGEPLAHLLLDADADELARTRNSQLSVLLTSLVAWEALRPLVDAPVAFGGHSLGQVTALIASGALPLEDGVRFAARRAELTQQCADATPGRMVALLGATLEQAEAACAAAPDACWIANDNSDGQVVVAGTPEGVELASTRAKELGVKRATPLKVGGAFHTPLMQPAADGLTEVLASVDFAEPVAPVVANDDAALHEGADGWRERSARHVAVPVRWRPCMLTLASLSPAVFVEVGNGSMLAGLGKRTLPSIAFRNVAVPNDLQALTRED
jgi:[acyl-carrier-protein] S-malonyltransferase